MSRLSRVYAITLVLAKSQLRANRSGRSGESIFRNAAILGVIDIVCFLVLAGVGLFATRLLLALPAATAAPVENDLVESLVFVPALVPSAVLVAGVLFELSASSKFASSDSVNWLPVTQGEYVLASTLSVAYAYSVVPSLIMGFTLYPAFKLGYGGTWVEMLLLSVVSLIYGGAIVEILRAAINRVSNVVMGRARRGALVLRLAATVGVILVVEVIFNFVFLLDVLGRFSSALNRVSFLPVVWASLAVRASEMGDASLNVAYALATLLFTGAMLFAAVKVRAKYWSPVPSQVVVSQGEYVPGIGTGFGRPLLGLTGVEATIVRKDLKGFTRRRELLQYFAIPFVLAIVLIVEFFFAPSGTTSAGASAQQAYTTDQIPVWFVGGLFGLIISSISFGQEQRSASLLYSLPITWKQVLRAKIFLSGLVATVATVSIFAAVALIARPPPLTALEFLLVGVAATAEEVCLGTGFGARYPDFQERPRPRFVDPIGILVMVFVGMGVMIVTVVPAIVSVALPPAYQPLVLVSLAIAVAVSLLSYRWAGAQTQRLFVEFRS